MQSLKFPAAARILRNDPAPSRWSYRFMRLMLSPILRRMVVYGIPTAVVVLITALYFSNDTRREKISQVYFDFYQSVINRPEFMVNIVEIQGASPELDKDIRDILPVAFPVSQFNLDLPEIHDLITELAPVERAELQVRTGGILQVTVNERQPVVIWRGAETLDLLDAKGAYIRSIVSRLDYPDLPLIAGHGGDSVVPQALAILAAVGPLQSRLRGMVYVGQRRWDLVLDNDQRILLPEKNPSQAVERVLVLDQSQSLLQRAVSVVDMRLSNRPTVRMAPQETEDILNTNQTTSETKFP